MLAYYEDASGQVEEWRDEVPKLRSALDRLRTGMVDLPAEVQVHPGDFDDALELLAEDQQHLEDFVRDVAHELLRADGYGHWVDGNLPAGEELDLPTGVLTVDEDAINVGPADRYVAVTDDAEADAEEYEALLEEAGLLDLLDEYDPQNGLPWHYTDFANATDLEPLLAWMEQHGDKLDDPYYATVFYNTLGADGIIATGTFLAIQAHNNPGEETRQLAEPFTTGFAHATSGLDPDIYAQLLDFGSITDPTAQSVHLATAPHRPRSHQTSYDRVKPR